MATTLNVQFTDSTQATIASYFGAPQDPAVYANLGTVSTADAKWKTYYGAQPVAFQASLPSPTTN